MISSQRSDLPVRSAVRILIVPYVLVAPEVRPRKRLRLDNAQVKDKFNLSNDQFYTHPVLSTDGVRARRRFVQLNARAVESGRHRAFAGAWLR